MKTNLKTKWTIGLFGGFLMSLTILGCGTVHTEIVIPASTEQVWSILTDVAGYKAWNPVLIPVEGELREGEKLTYQMIQPDGKQSEVKAKVIKRENGKLLNQFGGIPGILTFNHKWLLEPVDGKTRVTQHEEYRGVWVWFWDYSWVEPAYQKANEALRDRVAQLQNK